MLLRDIVKGIPKKVNCRLEKEITKFLSTVIDRQTLAGTIKISSQCIIKQMLYIFGMKDCKPKSAPLHPETEFFVQRTRRE